MKVAVIAVDRIPNETVLPDRTGMPLGAMAISGALQDARFDSEVFAQSHHSQVSWQRDLLAKVADFQPSLVAFSTFTHSWPDCVSLAEKMAEVLPAATIVFGGWHISGILWHAARNEFPDLWQDFVRHPEWLAIPKEGYQAIVELANSLQYGHDPLQVPGVMAARGNCLIGVPSKFRLDPNTWPRLTVVDSPKWLQGAQGYLNDRCTPPAASVAGSAAATAPLLTFSQEEVYVHRNQWQRSGGNFCKRTIASGTPLRISPET